MSSILDDYRIIVEKQKRIATGINQNFKIWHYFALGLSFFSVCVILYVWGTGGDFDPLIGWFPFCFVLLVIWSLLSTAGRLQLMQKKLQKFSIELGGKEKETVTDMVNSYLEVLSPEKNFNIETRLLRTNDLVPFVLFFKGVNYLYLPRTFLGKIYNDEEHFKIVLAHEVGHICQEDSSALTEASIKDVTAKFILVIMIISLVIVSIQAGTVALPSAMVFTLIGLIFSLEKAKAQSEFNADLACLILTKNPEKLITIISSYSPNSSLPTKRIKKIQEIQKNYSDFLWNISKEGISLSEANKPHEIKIPDGFVLNAKYEVYWYHTIDKLEYQATFSLYSIENGYEIFGAFEWHFEDSLNVVELVRGKKINSNFFLKGFDKIDPQNVISLDEYNLTIKAPDNLYGKSKYTGNWDAEIRGSLVLA